MQRLHDQGNPQEQIFLKIVTMFFTGIFALDFGKCFHVVVAF